MDAGKALIVLVISNDLREYLPAAGSLEDNVDFGERHFNSYSTTCE